MSRSSENHADGVTNPLGEGRKPDVLPPSITTRWVTSRKAQLIAAIRSGVITIEEASERYRLTIDELSEWQSALDKHGKRGLRTTFVQQYRFLRGVNSERSE